MTVPSRFFCLVDAGLGEAVIAVEVDGEVAFTPVSEADDAGFAHEVQDVGADTVRRPYHSTARRWSGMARS